MERIALNYEHCPEIGKDPEPYFEKAAKALKPEGEHKYEYLANLCRWAECVAKRNRFKQADALYAELLAHIDVSLERESEWHWIATNCVEYFQARGQPELVAHLATKEAGYDADSSLFRVGLCMKTKAWMRRLCVNSVKKLEFPMSFSNNCIRSASQNAIRGSES